MVAVVSLSLIRDDDERLVTESPEVLGSGWLHVPPSYCGFLARLCLHLLNGELPPDVTDEHMEMLGELLDTAQHASRLGRPALPLLSLINAQF